MFRRFLAVLDARNKEFLRDTAALAWNFLFPILVVLGFSFAFSGGNQDVFKVAAVGSHAKEAAPAFAKTQYVQFVPVPEAELEATLKKLRHHQYDLVLGEPQGDLGKIRYWLNESAPKGYLLEKLLIGAETENRLEKRTVDGKEIRYVDWLISGLLAMNMMFSALFGVGYVIVRYRKNGVLKRLKATPLSPAEFLLAQVASRLILIMGVTAIVFFGCHALVHFTMLGSYFHLFFVLGLGAMCLISLGLLMAARIKSEEFAGGILNLISWPMMFLSGVWFSMEGASKWVKGAAQIFPLTHVIDASRAIMTEGAGLVDVAPHLVVLAVMTAVFLTVGAMIFKWE